MQKTIFITGASTGLGKATALLFAERGWKVIATMRNPENQPDLQNNPAITVFALDVTNAAQIAETAAKAIELGVDVVFNNAGYGLAGPVEGITDEQIVTQINTNLLGVLRVTKAFLTYFREKRAGLFITTTSIGGLITLPLNSVYHATKWALEGFSESLAFELNPFGIDIKTVSPGGIFTDFMTRSIVIGQHQAYAEMMEQVIAAFNKPERQANFSTAEQIAEVVWEAATDGSKKLRYVAGKDANAMYEQRLAVGDEAFRAGIRANFFGE